MPDKIADIQWGAEQGLIKWGPSESDTVLYRTWHVESLLNQSADLLERCIKDRAEYISLDERYETLSIERLIEKHASEQANKRIDEKIHKMDFERLTMELDAKRKLINPERPSVSIYDRIKDNYYLFRKSVDIKKPDYYRADAEWSSAYLSEQLHILDKSSLEKEIAKAEYLYKQEELANTYMKEKNIEGRRDARLDNPLPFLNFNDRKKALEERFKDDFKDAYSRMSIAKEGMASIYGFSSIATFPINDPDKDTFGPLDSSLLWLRSAIRWLVAFGQLDQAWTAVYSLKQLVGSDNWDRNVNGNTNEAIFEFALPVDAFAIHAYCRLRGMIMFAHEEKDEMPIPYTANVQLPRKAISIHMRETANERHFDSVILDQTELPSCHFGRIGSPSSPRAPELVGAVSLANASPVQQKGYKWRIRLAAPRGGTFAQLKDITIELNMLGRPVKTDLSSHLISEAGVP